MSSGWSGRRFNSFAPSRCGIDDNAELLNGVETVEAFYILGSAEKKTDERVVQFPLETFLVTKCQISIAGIVAWAGILYKYVNMYFNILRKLHSTTIIHYQTRDFHPIILKQK